MFSGGSRSDNNFRTATKVKDTGSFLMVPICLEGQLLRELDIEPYGLTTGVRRAPPSKIYQPSDSDEVVSNFRRTGMGRMACVCPNGRQYCNQCVEKANSRK